MRKCKECDMEIVGRNKKAVFCTKDCNDLHHKRKAPSRSLLEVRKLAIKYKYGLEWADYERMHTENEGRCEICQAPLSLLKAADTETAYVDHCHTSGKVRGLLCNPCNRGLGYFRDSRLHLQKAMEYLDKHADSGSN